MLSSPRTSARKYRLGDRPGQIDDQSGETRVEPIDLGSRDGNFAHALLHSCAVSVKPHVGAASEPKSHGCR